MERSSLDQGTARTAAELRLQLAQMTAVSQVLGRSAQDEKSKRYLAALDQSICRMLRIVGRLELTDRLGEEGPDRLEPAPVDLAELVRKLGERSGSLLACLEVELDVRAPDRLDAQVDEGLIRQMLMELISNGAKAGRHVAVTLSRQGERAVFTVEDDGPGVEPERLEHLFNSAEEAVPDWRRSGVGVAIARRVAELHEGTLVASCAPGKGLQAVASIPLGAGEEELFKTPTVAWDRGGFDEELVALSDLLPAQAFGPDGG